ncbi:MAG TPA: Fe-S-containing hydro-lyase [Candidatus Latescibacteria bacterium]|nr:Fe-S-containing hydro-lyase [Candidatus Latescibacterota bacterium]
MTTSIKLTPPLSDKDISDLRSGDRITISGVLYTARDAAHKRLVELLSKGEKLPFDLKGQIIYYVGPTPAKPGIVIGAAGPTTSYRMDPYTIPLLAGGLKGMIGKGHRSPEVKKAMEKYKAVYFAAVGGAGALLAKHITKSEIIAFEDLGPEAIRKIEVRNFPAIVVNDLYGNDLYEEGIKKYKR